MKPPIILITRPAAAQAAEMQIARDAGWQPLVFPPLKIERDDIALVALPQQVQEADAVFWVSPGAVKLAAPVLNWHSVRAVQITVGAASARALAAFCRDEVLHPVGGNDSEAVLQMDVWQTLPPAAKILIVRGRGGRGVLAETLAERGFQVAFAEVYQRVAQPLDWQTFEQQPVRAAYITSSEITKALFDNAPAELAQKLETLLYLTHHARIAATLRRCGARDVRVIPQFDVQTLEAIAMTEQTPPPADDSGQKNTIVVTPEGVARPEEQASEPAVENTAEKSGAKTLPAPEKTAAPAAEKAAATTEQAAEKTAPPRQTTPPSGKHMAEQNQQPQPAAPVVIKQSSGKGLAAGAVVLALLGLGASGFLFVQGQNVLKTQELAFSQRIDKAAVGESQNAGMLQDSLRKQNDIDARLTQLQAGQQQNSEQIAAAQRAYQELLKGRVAWLVDEAEATLNLASQQLLLSGNVPVAVSVLENIEQRLSRFDKPELLPIKQAISQDLAELKKQPYLDVSGASLRIDRLETAVASLPLLVDNTLKPGASAPQPAANTGSWWQDTWQNTLNSLKGLVEVRRLDNNDAMLLAPEQAYFVRENLRLRLLDARVAMLQHNSDIYQSDLNNIESAVKTYFDPKSPATQSWLKELAELKSLEINSITDNVLKASLAAVAQYQESYRTGQTVALPADTPASAAQAASAPAAAAASAPASILPAPAPDSASPGAPAVQPNVSPQPVSPAEKTPEPKPAPKGEQA